VGRPNGCPTLENCWQSSGAGRQCFPRAQVVVEIVGGGGRGGGGRPGGGCQEGEESGAPRTCRGGAGPNNRDQVGAFFHSDATLPAMKENAPYQSALVFGMPKQKERHPPPRQQSRSLPQTLKRINAKKNGGGLGDAEAAPDYGGSRQRRLHQTGLRQLCWRRGGRDFKACGRSTEAGGENRAGCFGDGAWTGGGGGVVFWGGVRGWRGPETGVPGAPGLLPRGGLTVE